MASRPVKAGNRSATMAVGSVVPLDSGPAKIEAILRDADGRVTVLLDHGDHRTKVPWSVLARENLSRRPAPSTDAFDAHPAPILAELPEEARAPIMKRYRDLLQIQYGSPRGDAEGDRRAGILNGDYDPLETSRRDRLEAKMRELRALGEDARSRSHLYRQLVQLDEGPDALIHGNRRTLNQRLDAFDPAVLEVVRTEINEEQQRPHKSQRKLLARVRSRLLDRGIGGEVSRYQLECLVGEVSRGLSLHHPAKTRRSEASRPVAVYGTRRVSRPGELVQIDATPTTVAILGPEGVYVPAVILSAIDIHTRFFVALRVCVGAATSRDVCALIAQMGRPTVTRAGYPYELEYWHGIPKLIVVNDDPEGIKTDPGKVIGKKPKIHPSTIVFDHGSENASDHVMRYAAECGIDVVFCPPRRGHAKGVVEAIHRVLGGVESTMPIHKGQNVLNRPRELELAIPIKPQDLQDMLWEYIIDIYAHEPHRGLTEAHGSDRDLSPAGVWSDYVIRFGEIETPLDPYIYLKGLERDQRHLTPAGIRLHKTTYNSSDLQALRPIVMSGIGVKARTLTIFFDRLDRTRIFILHPVERYWLVVLRASDRNASAAPMSGLVEKLAAEELDRDTRRVSTEEERHHAEAALISRWREGIFTGRQDARFACIESARQHSYAHDLEAASQEVLALAFPPVEESQATTYPETAGSRTGAGPNDEDCSDEEIAFDEADELWASDESGWGLG